MAFKVGASPEKVSWIFATPVAHLAGNQLANTDVAFDIPPDAALNAQRNWVLTGQWIMIHPIVTFKTGTPPTTQLLAHEQGHLDIGMLIARALARDLDRATGHSPGVLRAAVQQIRQRHVKQHMPPIQALYDKETDHGTKSNVQSQWTSDIQAALSTPALQTFKHLPL